MLNASFKTTDGNITLHLPTSIYEITKEYINNVVGNVKIAPNYSLIGVIFKDKLSNIVIARNRNNKNTNINVIPIFVRSGKSDSDFINNLNSCEKLIISASDIMLGHHVSAPRNLITINNILNIIDKDRDGYTKAINISDICYFIEFKLVPNCNIHGSYGEITSNYNNPFVVTNSI